MSLFSYDGTAETDDTTNSGGTLVKEITINGSGMPAGAGALALAFTAGHPNEIQCDNQDNFGGLTIGVSATSGGFTGVTVIWDSSGGPEVNTWTDILTLLGTNPIIPFTNPNPSGNWYLSFVASTGAGGASPAGIRHFMVEIDGTGPTPVDADIETPTVGTIEPTADLVFTATSGSDLAACTAIITAADGASVVAFSLAAGFAPGFTGTSVGISDGIRVTIRKLGLWPMGAMTLAISATDTAPTTDTDTRTWTVGIVLPAAGVQDYVAQALSRVIIQYRGSQKLLAEIKMHASIVQHIANVLAQIPPLDDPAIAMGTNLDMTGEIVGQTRDIGDGNTATDGELEVLIGARITRNNARVSVPDFLAALGHFFGAPIVLIDHGGMAISYTVLRAPTADEIALLNGDIVARPMGVKITRSFVVTVPYFGFQGDPNAGGFSDHTGTVGAPLAQEF